MKVLNKIQLPPIHAFSLTIPRDSEFLGIFVEKHEIPYLHFMTNEPIIPSEYKFIILTAGQTAHPSCKLIGTFQVSLNTYHLFRTFP